MRKIKFRAWDLATNRMLVPGFDILGEVTAFGIVEKILMEKPEGKTTLERMADVVVMQFTGLKDKNGKDIYEGDILNFSFDGVGFIQNPYYVIFEKGAFVINKPNFHPLVSDCENISIVGNIYQHPELLTPPLSTSNTEEID